MDHEQLVASRHETARLNMRASSMFKWRQIDLLSALSLDDGGFTGSQTLAGGHEPPAWREGSAPALVNADAKITSLESDCAC